jgi:hypothetical protein
MVWKFFKAASPKPTKLRVSRLIDKPIIAPKTAPAIAPLFKIVET